MAERAPTSASTFSKISLRDDSVHLDSIILLAGGLRPSPLVQAVGISVLDLPLRVDQTVLERWLSLLAQTPGDGSANVDRIVVAYTSNSPQPALPRNAGQFASLRFVCDQTGLRGPAGTARDLCRSLDENATILLGEAARFLRSDLCNFVRTHASAGAETTIGRNPDGSPAGLYLTKRRVLDLVPEEGFMDLKEQWLNKAMNNGRIVNVHTFDTPVSYPLRLWEQYLQAVRLSNTDVGTQEVHLRFSPIFGSESGSASLTLPGAKVASTSKVIDSVLMPGCEIESEAVVVRSFVGSGVKVSRGATLVDVILPQENATSETPKPPTSSMTISNHGRNGTKP